MTFSLLKILNTQDYKSKFHGRINPKDMSKIITVQVNIRAGKKKMLILKKKMVMT